MQRKIYTAHKEVILFWLPGTVFFNPEILVLDFILPWRLQSTSSESWEEEGLLLQKSNCTSCLPCLMSPTTAAEYDYSLSPVVRIWVIYAQRKSGIIQNSGSHWEWLYLGIGIRGTWKGEDLLFFPFIPFGG